MIFCCSQGTVSEAYFSLGKGAALLGFQFVQGSKYATHICIRTIQSIYIILIFQISISWKWIWIRYFPNQYCKPARVFRAQRDSNVENASIRLRPNHQQSCSWLLEIPIHFILPQTTQHTLCRLITTVLRYLIHWPLENSAVILKL